jgi:predicted transcriptional regulator of viral defense system
MSAIEFISGLMAQGQYCFNTKEVINALGRTPVATCAALRRLKQKGQLARPYKGFYVIVPPEFRDIGCLPVCHFIPSLMEEHLGERYYAGLLSVAEYHGAFHYHPQVFHVMVARNIPGIICGKIRVEFVARKNMEKIPIEDVKTPRGCLKISTPAATAFDLVGYPYHAAGLDNVANILAELHEKIDGVALADIAELSPIAWSQRLGYLLDLVGAQDKSEELAKYVALREPVPTPLAPSLPFHGISPLKRWNILVNAMVEAEV